MASEKILVDLAAFICLVVAEATGAKLFNLIATDKSIAVPPYHATTAHYRQCFSICSLNPECRSFDYSYASNFGECNFYYFATMLAFNHTNYLQEKIGVKYYSLSATDCVDWYKLGYRKNGIYEVYLLGEHKRRVYCHMEAEGGAWMAFQRRFDGKNFVCVQASEDWQYPS